MNSHIPSRIAILSILSFMLGQSLVVPNSYAEEHFLASRSQSDSPLISRTNTIASDILTLVSQATEQNNTPLTVTQFKSIVKDYFSNDEIVGVEDKGNGQASINIEDTTLFTVDFQNPDPRYVALGERVMPKTDSFANKQAQISPVLKDLGFNTGNGVGHLPYNILERSKSTVRVSVVFSNLPSDVDPRNLRAVLLKKYPADDDTYTTASFNLYGEQEKMLLPVSDAGVINFVDGQDARNAGHETTRSRGNNPAKLNDAKNHILIIDLKKYQTIRSKGTQPLRGPRTTLDGWKNQLSDKYLGNALVLDIPLSDGNGQKFDEPLLTAPIPTILPTDANAWNGVTPLADSVVHNLNGSEAKSIRGETTSLEETAPINIALLDTSGSILDGLNNVLGKISGNQPVNVVVTRENFVNSLTLMTRIQMLSDHFKIHTVTSFDQENVNTLTSRIGLFHMVLGSKEDSADSPALSLFKNIRPTLLNSDIGLTNIEKTILEELNKAIDQST